ncbi:MAG: phosphoglycerate mutase, partial [Planctomycetes bacterium]|nr:phosphoglycerate mutase [Planctomycetota bacterium]
GNALERIDELIVGPLLDALRKHDKWRILIAPDHPTPCTTTAHDATPPTVLLRGQQSGGGRAVSVLREPGGWHRIRG